MEDSPSKVSLHLQRAGFHSISLGAIGTSFKKQRGGGEAERKREEKEKNLRSIKTDVLELLKHELDIHLFENKANSLQCILSHRSSSSLSRLLPGPDPVLRKTLSGKPAK